MICKACGQPMNVVYAEPDAEYDNVTIETWHCEACGETVTEPDVDIIIRDEKTDEVDSYYGDPYEPYTIDDDTWGTCPECGSGLVNEGAMSDGDGDLYDSLVCPLCQEERGRGNECWVGSDGEIYDSEEEMWMYDALESEDGDDE